MQQQTMEEAPTTSSGAARLLVSKNEARWFLGGICLRTLEMLISNKELPVRRIGRRTLIPYEALVVFAHSNTEMVKQEQEARAIGV